MKPSHYTAPRTLAECQWTTGYTSASYRADAERRERFWHVVMYVLALAVAVVIVIEQLGV